MFFDPFNFSHFHLNFFISVLNLVKLLNSEFNNGQLSKLGDAIREKQPKAIKKLDKIWYTNRFDDV